MAEFSELQQKVFDQAKEMLSNKPWFKGVCCDNFPSDALINQIGVGRAAQKVYDVTYMWDGMYSEMMKGENEQE